MAARPPKVQESSFRTPDFILCSRFYASLPAVPMLISFALASIPVYRSEGCAVRQSVLRESVPLVKLGCTIESFRQSLPLAPVACETRYNPALALISHQD